MNHVGGFKEPERQKATETVCGSRAAEAAVPPPELKSEH